MNFISRKKKIIKYIIILISILFSSNLYSNGCGDDCKTPMEAAEILMNEGKHKAALNLYTAIARSGNKDAQYKLYRIYRNMTPAPDPNIITKWLILAAKNNHDSAQFELSEAYKAESMSKEANFWLKKAAENKNPIAINNLGVAQLIKKKYKKACEFFEESSSLGLSEAQYNFSIQIIHDRCEKGNRKKAFNLLLKSSKQGNAQAQHDLAIMYEEGDGVKKDVDEAIYWLSKAISKKGIDSDSDALLSYFIRKYNKGALVRAINSKLTIKNASHPGTNGSSFVITDGEKIEIESSTQRGGTAPFATVRDTSEVILKNNKVKESKNE